MPLVDLGLVNLIPDPCSFDIHLRDQMLSMAKTRSAGQPIDPRKEPRIDHLMKQDFERGIMSLPEDVLRSQLLRASPELDEVRLQEALRYIAQLKERDPLAVLQEDSLDGGQDGGQFNFMKLAPNFEMTLYLAQATGSCIVTDSHFRWTEVQKAIRQRAGVQHPGLAALARDIESSEFAFPQNVTDIVTLAFDETFAAYPALIRDIFKYISHLSERGPKPNREAQLIGRLAKTHSSTQAAIKKEPCFNKRGSNFLRISSGRYSGQQRQSSPADVEFGKPLTERPDGVLY